MPNPCVGIDLGTTYSAIAVINPAGKPEIVPNQEGNRITQSAVFFQDNGPMIVGQLAANAAGGYPDRVVQWVKPHMDNKDWSFSVDDRAYSVMEISSIILKKVKQDAEMLLGPIKYAVVTVPAYFEEAHRVATKGAAELAGLDVLRIVNEPTAAAIAYAVGGGRPGTVLVYDFGGGTFDVSIVRIGGVSDVEVIATAGDHKLGGHNLDENLALHYANLFSSEKNIQVEKGSGEAWFTFLQCAEEDKRKLSRLQSIRRSLPWKAHSVNVEINRETFEDLIGDEIVRTEMLVDNVLADANLNPRDIDEVLMVGGSSRIPAVRAMLKRKFGKDPSTSINVEEAVALGAAIQSGVIMSKKGISNLSDEMAEQMRERNIQDRTAHSLGTLAVTTIGGAHRIRNVIIIPKNSLIPITKTEVFSTIVKDQPEVDCSVTQGEDEDPEFLTFLLKQRMPLPPGRPAGCPIEVKYSYNSDGVMKFEFKDVESGQTKILESIDARIAQKQVDAAEADFDDLEIE